MTDECCPLCKSNVGKLRVLFVEHVMSKKSNMEAWAKGDLKFADLIAELDEARGKEHERV